MAEKLNILQIGAGGAGSPVPAYFDSINANCGGVADFNYTVADFNAQNANGAIAGLPDSQYHASQIDVTNRNHLAALLKETTPKIVFCSLPPSLAHHVLEATLWAHNPQIVIETALSNSSGNPIRDPENFIPLGALQDLYGAQAEHLGTAHIVTGVNPGADEVALAHMATQFDQISDIRFVDAPTGPELTTFAPSFCPEAAVQEGIMYPNKFSDGKIVYTHPLQHHINTLLPGETGPQHMVRMEHEEPVTTGMINPRFANSKIDYYMGVDPKWLRLLQTLAATGVAANRSFNALQNATGRSLSAVFGSLLHEAGTLGYAFENDSCASVIAELESYAQGKLKRNYPTGLAFISSLLPNPALQSAFEGSEHVGVAVQGVKDGEQKTLYSYQRVDARDFNGKSHVLAQTAGSTAATLWQAANGVFDGTEGRISMSDNPKPLQYLDAVASILPAWNFYDITGVQEYGTIFSR